MGDEFPQSLHMDGMMENLAKGKFKPFSDFADDLKVSNFSKSYVFIEPGWHPFTKFKRGNSQHPMDDVECGELLQLSLQIFAQKFSHASPTEKKLLIEIARRTSILVSP